MAEEIEFSKKVFDKRTYVKTINTSFSELGSDITDPSPLQERIPSVQEFFDMYNTLFYQINEKGPSNSHEYLIKTSGDYIGTEQDNELINLLQAEIASLREQLLESQKQLTELSIAAPDVPEIPLPEIPEPPPPPPLPKTPTTPPPPDNPTDKARVIMDYKLYSKGTVKKRAERLNLNRAFVKKIKKQKNL